MSLKRRDFIKSLSALAGASVLPFGANAFTGSDKEFEFIIVGSGAGGGPLAVNLAKAGFQVLLIEAGGDELPMSAQIPAYHTIASEDPKISWDFYVRHHDQNYMHGKWNTGKGILYPRSSVVGGCTTSNAMVCLYPDPKDWDRIFKLTGKQDSSWNHRYMRELFLNRIENSQYFADKERGWQSTEMTPINMLRWGSQLQKIALSAAQDKSWLFDEIWKAGWNTTDNIFKINSYLDANNPYLIRSQGFQRAPKFTYMGKRHGVFDLVQGARRQHRNLTVMPHTFVKKIIFEKTRTGLKAKGVEVLKGKNIYLAHKSHARGSIREEIFLRAQKEVILCGGAYNSPQLLMLSGIGPADQYEAKKVGAPIKAEPIKVLDGVGRNLQDRYEVSVVSELKENIGLLENCEFSQEYDNPESDQCLKDWMNAKEKNKEVYGTNGVLATIKMKSSVAEDGKNDLVLFGVPGDFRGYYPGYSKDVTKKKNRFTWVILKGYSRNRCGRVTLKSDNCLETPNIHFNYFQGEGAGEDMQAVLEGINRVRGINRRTFGESHFSHKFKDSRPGKGELYPGAFITENEDLRSWVQREAWGHHASCTNKMGISSQDGSVVNYNFKVHGTTNLRVVDASVFPEIPGTFIVTPIYMISEKASDVIIKKYS